MFVSTNWVFTARVSLRGDGKIVWLAADTSQAADALHALWSAVQ